MRNKGYTLIEIMVAVVFVFVFGIIAFTFIGGSGLGGDTAGWTGKTKEELARETTLAKFPPEIRANVQVTGTTCDTWDTDNNGRVRCTVNYMERGNTDLSAIKTDIWECPSTLSAARTCVPMRHGTGRGLF